ncbi:MAG TPA: FadR/GntR family transcriptional regulator, partial [Pirellulales bacterium]
MSGVARVVTQLEDSILNGAYAPGDALPPERELAAQLGVSRSVLREALGQLANMGLITRLQGSGTRVASRSGDAVLAGYGRLLRTGAHSLEDLMVVRIPLETIMARLAAQHRTDAHIERLRVIQERFGDPTRALDDSVQADVDFHVELARASGNRIFEFVLKPIEQLLIESRRQTLTRDGIRGAWAEHEAIFDAVRRGDPNGAEAAMRFHLMRITFADLPSPGSLQASVARSLERAAESATTGATEPSQPENVHDKPAA